jgi:hypothetical protein
MILPPNFLMDVPRRLLETSNIPHKMSHEPQVKTDLLQHAT